MLFMHGLRYSLHLMSQLTNSWRALTARGSTDSDADTLTLSGQINMRTTDGESFSHGLEVGLLRPRLLSTTSKGKKGGADCELVWRQGVIASLNLRRSATGARASCRLALVNPSDRPVLVQMLLLDSETTRHFTTEVFDAARIIHEPIDLPAVCPCLK